MTALTADEQALVWEALNDAASYRLGKLTACAACDAGEKATGAATCDDHRADYEMTDRYNELGRALVRTGLVSLPEGWPSAEQDDAHE